MHVIDHEPQTWFLLQHDNALFLNINCDVGFIGYCLLIELRTDEIAGYRKKEHGFITRVASEIQNTAPILEATASVYKGRDVSKLYAEQVTSAVLEWRRKQG